MWVKQCHKPPMTGNGLYYTTYIFMVMTGGWFMIVLPTLWENERPDPKNFRPTDLSLCI